MSLFQFVVIYLLLGMFGYTMHSAETGQRTEYWHRYALMLAWPLLLAVNIYEDLHNKEDSDERME